MLKNLLEVENAQNVKKTRIGDYRLIYYIVSDNNKFVELSDIGFRKNIYNKWD